MKRALFVVALAACGSSRGATGDDEPSADGPQRDAAIQLDASSTAVSVFDPSITHVDIEIDYETGNAPYTGTITGFGDTFDLSTNNVGRLFADQKMLDLPRATARMQDVGTIADEELSVADLLALADAHRSKHDTAGHKTYYVLFVSGHYADANGPQQGVLGLSLGGTGVIAMFKDVIDSTGVPGFSTVRHVEQTTLIHELAHAIGLVDNGVPMVAAHKDAAHGAHCSNEQCVMHYLNEGSAIGAFVTQAVLANSSILFDAACLADVDALTGGP